MSIRKPIVIEFTGTPNSGKTTLIHNLSDILTSNGYIVETARENAEVAPKEIPKKTWIRNVWITLNQLQSLLESKYSTSDIIFLDRGYYDALFWAMFYQKQGFCSLREANFLINFIKDLNKTFSFAPDYLFVVDVSVEESLKRRAAQSNEQVTISNNEFLSSYRKELTSFCRIYKYPFFKLNSTSLSRDEATKIAYDVVRLWISLNS